MGSMFHSRFNLAVPLVQAQAQFANRASTMVFTSEPVMGHHYDAILKQIIIALGAERIIYGRIDHYVEKDFLKTLLALETIHRYFKVMRQDALLERIDSSIRRMLQLSAVDLGVRWDGEVFMPSGAPELDQALVNDVLKWLSDPRFETVREPYEKSLRHLLEAHKRPELMNDVITDAYEALEALSKIVAGSTKDLSSNREKMLSNMGSLTGLGMILKEYITYGCRYRHAVKPGETREIPTEADAEAFVYLTGLFIRLVVGNTAP